MSALAVPGDSTLGLAVQLISAYKYDEAIAELSDRAKETPEKGQPWALLGLALSLKGRYRDALTAVEQSLTLEGDHGFAQQLRTGLLLQLGVIAAAVEAAEQLANQIPDRAESHAFLAMAHAQNGNDLHATHAALTARKLAPEKAIGHQASCAVHLAFNRWEDAEQHAMMALALDKPSAPLLHDLGLAYAGQNRMGEARQAFDMAARMDPRFLQLSRKVPRYHRGPTFTVAATIALLSGVLLLTKVDQAPEFFAIGTVGATFGFAAFASVFRRPLWWYQVIVPCTLGFFGAAVLAVLIR